MKILIVAHPDDEVLWFNPEEFDRILIVFQYRIDKPDQGAQRAKAIEEHPLAGRIGCLGFEESNYWRDKSKKEKHEDNYNKLCGILRNLANEMHGGDEVTTHNALGEYQHADHILVHNACMETMNCRVNGKNPEIYRKAKAAYERNGCWTWY
jgi:LmbE family N-acetylglucosaminyl deacetylase